MSGLLGDYEDSDEDENAPSILAQQAGKAGLPAGAAAKPPDAAAQPHADAVTPKGSPVEAADAKDEGPAAEKSRGIMMTASPLAEDSSPSSAGRSPSPHPGEERVSLIPPSPPGEPDTELTARVRQLHDLKARGKNIREHLAGSRDYSNPYILERIIKVFEIDEHCSNYPKELFDPAKIAEHPSDYYDAPACERPPLPKRQKRGGDDRAVRNGLNRSSSAVENGTVRASPPQDNGTLE
eukprot:gnl/TRDRNA2_/TRDRNA2_180730_c0_seq1.p1 gnl/TRDRNA2_/TRDRNA2_180730_c0~~gnl/TRDRNA2_/TRDRNA2_180730_c0_seq1.p1  ORF type:complete len:238 (+),score=56.30 gnl/TRDRNA2_/TRDRNA2_180730_c0_seq1:39-752(+)